MAQLIARTEAKLLKLEARVRRRQLEEAAEIAAADRAVAGPVRRLSSISTHLYSSWTNVEKVR